MKQNFAFRPFATAFSAALILLFSVSCSKKDDDVKCKDCQPPTTEPVAPKFKMAFSHTVDAEPLVFGVEKYRNALNQPYRVTELKYFISNVKLSNTTSGKSFSEPNSYHLLNPTTNISSFTINNLPEESYDKIEFSIGVDAAANASTDKTGDLDPVSGMAWDWNTGYKFLSMNGFTNGKGLVYHVGGNKNYKNLSFPIQNPDKFLKDKTYTATVDVNLAELFRGPNQISFDSTYNVMSENMGTPLAENYGNGMFTFKGIIQ